MPFANILKDKYLRVVTVLSLLILFIAAIIFYLTFGSTAAPLIIHFSPHQGIDFLGDRLDVAGIWLSGLIIILINLFLANFIYNRERFLAYLFIFAGLLLAILILIAIAVIINVN